MSKKRIFIRFLLTIFLFLLLAPVLLFFVFQIPSVQKKLNDKITFVINEKLNTSVTIEQIAYKAPFDIILLNLYIEDYQKDTLINIDYLKIRPLYYGFRRKTLTIDNITVRGFRAEYRIDSTGYSNFDFFIANLPETSKDETDKKSSSSKISINKVIVKNSSIFYSTDEKDTMPYQLDLDTIDIQKLNFKIKKISFQNDSISLKIEKFGFAEKSGFMVRNFSTNLTYSDSELAISNFKLRLNKSRFLIDEASINYTSIDQLREHPENVFTKIDLKEQTKIDFSDLGYFSPLFKNYHESIKIGFVASGNLGNLIAEKLKVIYKSDTYFYANFEMMGLPKIDNLYFDFQILDFNTNINEILSLKNPLNDSYFIEIPSHIRMPQMINFKGGLTGMLDDFSFIGNLVSSAGNLYTEMSIQRGDNASNIAGNFELQSFDIGYVLRNEMIGKVSLFDTVDFTMIDSNTFRGYNNANIYQAEFNNYNYKNIVSDIYFLQDSISAKISVRDTNLKMFLNSSIKLDGVNTISNFEFSIDKIRFYPLNFIKGDDISKIDTNIFLSMKLQGTLIGNNLDDLEGKINLEKPLYITKNLQELTIKNFTLDIKNSQKIGDNTAKTIQLKSDNIDGSARGTFDFEELAIFGQNIAGYYFPALIHDSIVDLFQTKKEISSNLEFYIKLKDLESITSLFFPQYTISKNTEIIGNIISKSKQFNVSITSDSIIFSENIFNNLSINLKGDTTKISTSIKCDSIKFSKFLFENFSTTIIGKNDSMNLNVSWQNSSEAVNSGQIRTNLTMHNDTSDNLQIKFLIPKDTIIINNKLWTLYSDSIFINSDKIIISKITFSSFLKQGSNIKQYIGIYGKISQTNKDTLFMSMQKFDISQLNPILTDITMEGYMNSDFIATNLRNNPKVVMHNNINKFKINDVALGEIVQTIKLLDKDTLYNKLSIQKIEKRWTKIDGKDTLVVSKFRSLFVEGNYLMENSTFDFTIIIDNLKLKPFAPYLNKYVKFSRNSNLNGNLEVKGDRIMYDVDGEINLFGAFLLPKTGVSYTINGGMNIKLEKNLITIDTTIIAGPKLVGDALLYGKIKHKNFHDPFINMYFRADTIAFLDLPRTNSSKYYGTIISSGNIEIDGYLEDLSVTADIVTEKNTDFTLLLDRPEEVSNKTSIVTFVTVEDTTKIEEIEEKKSSLNLDLDLNLTLNPDAKFKIIFDELTGESLDIQGEGTIKLKQTILGELVIFGKIAIERGVYKFILENIVNRKFEIIKGSSIVFNGNPREGIIDISTVYSIKNVALYNLLMDETYAEQKTQANCFIKLTGAIMNPTIRFSVELPKADKRIANQVEKLDDANQNKQFLSLLLFGIFQPLPGLTFDPNVTFNASGLISNQLNSLLSNMNTDIDLDVNYVTGNEQVSDQFDVGMSFSVNDKINFNTDVGVGGNTTASPDQNNIIGDFEVDVKLNEKGNIRLKAFNKTNRNEFYQKGPYTQGIGISYKKEFDHIFKRDTNSKVILDTIN